jgi:hypothetical protein
MNIGNSIERNWHAEAQMRYGLLFLCASAPLREIKWLNRIPFAEVCDATMLNRITNA